MFASFLYNFSETEILLLGIFINLSGIIGCIIFGIYENILGVERNIFISILGLTFLSLILLFVDSKINFWIIAMSIGFFIGPIQACSRSLLVEKLNLSDQMGAFSLFSMLGNVCAILGPFLVGYVIDVFTSIKAGLFIIPLFFSFIHCAILAEIQCLKCLKPVIIIEIPSSLALEITVLSFLDPPG